MSSHVHTATGHYHHHTSFQFQKKIRNIIIIIEGEENLSY